MGRRGERSAVRILRIAGVVGDVLRFVHHVSRGRGAEVLCCLLLSVLLVTALAPSAYASNYVYDANGRLVAVTDTSGNTIAYNYDAVGNILSIQPLAAGQLALFVFTPQQGVVNSTVTLQGNGFSATPGCAAAPAAQIPCNTLAERMMAMASTIIGRGITAQRTADLSVRIRWDSLAGATRTCM